MAITKWAKMSQPERNKTTSEYVVVGACPDTTLISGVRSGQALTRTEKPSNSSVNSRISALLLLIGGRIFRRNSSRETYDRWVMSPMNLLIYRHLQGCVTIAYL